MGSRATPELCSAVLMLRAVIAGLLVLRGLCDDPPSNVTAAATAESATALAGLEYAQVGRSGGRPSGLYYPSNCSREWGTWQTVVPCPVVVVLHALDSNGTLEDAYLHVSSFAADMGFGLLLPELTWRAADVMPHNDLYVLQLLNETQHLLSTTGLYLIGHGSGGALAAAVACMPHSGVKGVAGIGGMSDDTDCPGADGIERVVIAHGTLDAAVPYDTSVVAFQAWRDMKRCPKASRMSVSRDYDCDDNVRPAVTDISLTGPSTDGQVSNVPGMGLDSNCGLKGNETTVIEYGPCDKAGSSVSLWKMQGAGQRPALSKAFTHDLLQTLLSQPGKVARRHLR